MFISGDALFFCLCFCPARQHGLGNASAHQQMNWNRMKIIVSCIETHKMANIDIHWQGENSVNGVISMVCNNLPTVFGLFEKSDLPTCW